jgi:glycosyltransferase involved in cell wall biosynthesis
MGYRKAENFRVYAKKAAEQAGRIIVISRDIENLVKELFPACEDKLVLMKNGYDNHVFYPDETDKKSILAQFNLDQDPEYLVVFAGKLAHFKGVDVLLKAAAVYEEKLDHNVCTLIAGDGELSAELRSMAHSLDLQNVHFLGHQTQQVLRKLYSAADISVVPSRREPFGLVAIEALACGTPVVATEEGGLAEIINKEVGALVPVDDSQALAGAINDELMRTDHDQRKMQAMQYALEKYSQEKMIGDLVQVYEHVIQESKK